MKANEFFKKVGIEAVKSYIAAYEDHLTDELKRLVESHELVCSLNGLIGAKASIREVFEDYPHDYMNRKLHDFDVKCCVVSKAIADVESCMEVNQ